MLSYLWCHRRHLSVPWTTRRSNQSIIKGNQLWIFIIRTGDAEAEASILGTWFKELTLFKKKNLMLVKIEVRKRRGQQRMRCLDGIIDLMDMSLSKLWWRTGMPGMLQSMESPCQTWLSDWTKTSSLKLIGRYGTSSLRNLPLVPSHLRGKRLIYPFHLEGK